MSESEKGIMMHYVENNDFLDDYKKQMQEKMPEFKHVYHITGAKIGFDIIKQPIQWIKEYNNGKTVI